MLKPKCERKLENLDVKRMYSRNVTETKHENERHIKLRMHKEIEIGNVKEHRNLTLIHISKSNVKGTH